MSKEVIKFCINLRYIRLKIQQFIYITLFLGLSITFFIHKFKKQ